MPLATSRSRSTIVLTSATSTRPAEARFSHIDGGAPELRPLAARVPAGNVGAARRRLLIDQHAEFPP